MILCNQRNKILIFYQNKFFLLLFSDDKKVKQACIIYLSHIKSCVCFDWRNKIINTSLLDINLFETAIQNLPFLFYKKTNQNSISILFETLKDFNETAKIVFIKNFRILMCTMYGKAITQNNNTSCQEELFCVDCDKNKIKKVPQTSLIDDTFKKVLNKHWNMLLLSFVNDSNTVIRCEMIKYLPVMINHFYPDNSFRNQMLMLINDNNEDVRIQCSKILNSIIFEKNSSGDIQLVELYFPQMLEILCSTVNNSLKFGNNELQYTCLETIFNVGW